MGEFPNPYREDRKKSKGERDQELENLLAPFLRWLINLIKKLIEKYKSRVKANTK